MASFANMSLSHLWRLEDLRIGVRLRLAFACVLLFMLAGSAVSLWYFQNLRDRTRRVSEAGQRVTAVVRVNNSLLTLMSRLHRAADSRQSDYFQEEATRLLSAFHSDTDSAAKALREITPATGREEMVIGSFNQMRDELPARISSFAQLARTGDWLALHARLSDQVDHTDDVAEALMREAHADLSQARKGLSDDIDKAERRAMEGLAAGSLLAIIAAALLGMAATRSITGPLAKLDGGARALARGDFNHRVALKGSNELATLGRVFDQTAQELAGLFNRLSIANRALHESNQALQRANEDLNVFAFSASHDLQEPLRNISLYSQMLQKRSRGQLDSQSNEFIRYLVEGAGHMSELIDDLLTYIQASNFHMEGVTTASAGVAVERALSGLKAAVLATKATVIADDLPSVAVEAVHLQQLFQNLIGNAIKYRSEEPPEIRISARETQGFWEFSVKDNGIGIDPQYGTQIFKPFKRLHGRTSYPGTGIGLAICQKIVDRYGGRIWIEPHAGKGSDFRFALPEDHRVNETLREQSR
jgi:signal transduction histidine kinase